MNAIWCEHCGKLTNHQDIEIINIRHKRYWLCPKCVDRLEEWLK